MCVKQLCVLLPWKKSSSTGIVISMISDIYFCGFFNYYFCIKIVTQPVLSIQRSLCCSPWDMNFYLRNSAQSLF